jgi:hypothetical protein
MSGIGIKIFPIKKYNSRDNPGEKSKTNALKKAITLGNQGAAIKDHVIPTLIKITFFDLKYCDKIFIPTASDRKTKIEKRMPFK